MNDGSAGLRHVVQSISGERDETCLPGALDLPRQGTLATGARAGLSAWLNASALRDKAAQRFRLLEVHHGILVCAEEADPPPRIESPSAFTTPTLAPSARWPVTHRASPRWPI